MTIDHRLTDSTDGGDDRKRLHIGRGRVIAAVVTVVVLIAGGVWWSGCTGPVALSVAKLEPAPLKGRESAHFEGRVFAHYFPPYPISLDNADPSSDYYARHYLNPVGENGKFAAVGGLLRDRPLPRDPLPGNWRVTDLETEITQAVAAGIDGFTVDILSLSGQNWGTTVDLFTAAEQFKSDFRIVPNLDVTASAGDNATPQQVADALAMLYASPSAYRLPDGRYVLSSFKVEGRPVEWWTAVKNLLKEDHGYETALISIFLNASDANMREYAPISWAEGSWGLRNPAAIAQMPEYAAKAHALSMKWMAPVAVQDVRPRSKLYAEAGNTETLRSSWGQAIDHGADLVQLVTWNDYSESTSFAPSVAHGGAFLDLSAYYAEWFKTGAAPAISSEEMIVTHRIQPFAAEPRLGTELMSPTLNGSTMAPRDTVEVLTMLTAPGQLHVLVDGTSYTEDVPSGLHAVTFPLEVGTVRVAMTRDGQPIMGVRSPFTVTDYPEVQDLQYYAVTAQP